MTKQPHHFNLRLTPDLRMWAKMKAKMDNRSMHSLIINLIRDAMEKDNA